MKKHPAATLLLTVALSLADRPAFAAETPSVLPSEVAQKLDAQNVVWDTPSTSAKGSMPLGNGEVVVNTWVEAKTGDLMVLVARTDALSETCRFLKLGRLRVHFDGAPWAGAKDFRQEAKLRQGVVEISGGGLSLQVFVDANAHVLHVAGTSAKPLSATATVECWRNVEKNITDRSSWTTIYAPFKRTESADVFLPAADGAVAWYHRNETSVVPKLWETQSLTGLKGAFDPLTKRTFGGKLSGDGFVDGGARALKTAAPRTRFDLRLATHCAQTETVETWQAGLAQEDRKSQDAAAALERTRAWWQAFWDRSWVFVNETASVEPNAHPLRVGVDSNGQNKFAGDLEAQAPLADALTPEQVRAAFAAGRPEARPAPTMAIPDDARGLTFAAWIKPTVLSGGRLFDKCTAGVRDGILFDTQPGNALRLIVGNTALQSPACLKAGQWQFVAATYDAATGKMALYLDGKPVAEKQGGDPARHSITRGYILQRYAQGFQGRGAYPIKFNGGFFCADDADPDWRQWGDCYWWQNSRLPYHPMLACGDFDLMEPLFKMYADAVPLAESRTALYHGAQGAYFPETMTLFGTYGGDYVWNRKGRKPADVGCPWWQYAWNQGPELVSLMLDKWDYTHDEAFLGKEVLPMAQSVLRYFDTRFKKDAKGKIVLSPAQSVETYWHGVVNDAPTVAGLANITRRLCALPADAVPPEARAFFVRMREACPAIPVETAGGVRKLAAAERYNPRRSNFENPEIYPVWPYREVSLSRPELLAEGREAYARRKGLFTTGWAAYDGSAAALLGLTDEARRLLAKTCANGNPGFRWPAMWGPNFDFVPDMDNGGNLLEIANLMLLQGESGGKILLLPAWPRKWDVNFKLHAPDRTTVECAVKGGKIIKLQVAPESRRKDVVLPEGWQAP